MKKRILAALLANVLVLSVLAACSDETATETPVTEAATAATTAAPEEAQAAEETEAPAEPAAAAVPLTDTSGIAGLVFLKSFEGGVEGFEGRGPAPDDEDTNIVTVEPVKDTAHSGEYSLKTDGRVKEWNGAKFNVTDIIKKETEYTLSIWVYHEDAGEVQMLLSTETDVGTTRSYAQLSGDTKLMVPSKTWVELKGTYTWSNFDNVDVYVETGADWKTVPFYIDDAMFIEQTEVKMVVLNVPALKDAYEDEFLLGTAGALDDLSGTRLEFVTKHFTNITPGNYMKPDALHKTKDGYSFDTADLFVETALANGLKVNAHTLVWHEQSPEWLNGAGVTPEEAKANLVDHITAVVQHFSGKVESWDVVNEAMMDGTPTPGDWRASLRQDAPWNVQLGSDYIELAFRTAEAADPNVKLYYNDYNLDYPEKAQAVYNMVKELKEKGVKIDGIGMQAHYNDKTNPDNVRKSIELFASLGVEVAITELDITMDDSRGQDELTAEQAVKQGYLYAKLLQIFRENKDSIPRVTIWGYDDPSSWRAERFPLPFSKGLALKQAYYAIVNPDSFLAQHPDGT